MKKISILIPVFNEEESLPKLYERITKTINKIESYDWEILFVNDGSKDNTLSIVMQMQISDDRIYYLDLARNYGKEIAMLAGFDYVTGDCSIILDADLQDPPELIPKMVEYWNEGFDDVYAKRRNRKGESYIKKGTSKIFYRLLTKLTKVPIQRDTGDFRLLDRKCIDALSKLRESQRYSKGLFSWIGFNKKEIVFDRDVRFAGKTKWNYIKLINLAIDGITSFTTTPLRFSSFFGFIVSIMAFTYMVYIFIRALLYGDPVQGYPSMLVIILFLGGIQLLSIGIIGEYLGRIFHETKNRPPYFINTYNGIKQDK